MTEDQLFAVLDSAMPGRVFTPIAPANFSEPYIIYQDVTTQSQHTLCGYTGLDQVFWQVDSYARTRREAKSNMQRVIDALCAVDPQPTFDNAQSLYEIETRLNRRMVQVITWDDSTGETA
ncbi:DUF3168 domain-containing protein [Caballeronia sp. LP003]|uniref:DUF3168 domain-containing protein n=1 Tax=Caballeronia sp. LP003 TaxID=3038551 RepID=UPI00285994CF|nr:DUF3168 domain-containing protein [Caballeronia sp. LP003]MDR5790281.1 DUF3168 domain-containing protein [Caballeronia sp. LP003]